MKLFRLLLLIFIVLLASSVAYPQSQPPITIRESDGSPKLIQPTEIIVPNGSLTISGRKATLTFTGAPGLGTVTSVSIVTASGVSGSVANPTSTPALTLTLGAITPSKVTLSPSANTVPVTVSGYSLTGSNAQPLLDLSGTWNTSGNPTLIKTNLVNTSSGGSSLLLDLQVGGVSKFNVNMAGGITTVGGFTSGGQIVSSVSSANNRFGVSGTEAQIIVDGLATSFAAYIGASNVLGFNQTDWHIGTVPSDGFIDYNDSTSLMRIGVGGRKVTIGDRDGQGNNSFLTVNDVDANLSYQGGNVIFYFGEDTLPSPNPSSILELNTVTRGLLPPRMTTTQRDAIPSPAEGLELYNLTTHLKNYWNGSTWLNGGGGVSSSRAINTTSPLGGGGTLASDLTLTCSTCGVTGTGLNQFASTTSAQFLGIISNETGSGLVMGNDTPTIITPSFTTGFTIAGAAASRKIIVGNGTNFVASTETYPVPGTSGNLMTSDGTNWTSAAAAGGGAGDVIANATRTVNTLTKWTNTTTKEIGNSLIVDDGTNILLNLAATNGLLQLGGATSSFPALSFTGTRIDFVTANNAALADIQASKLTLSSSNGLFLGTQTRIIGTSGVAEFVNVGASAYASARVDTIFLTGASLLNDTAINRTAAGVARFTDASSGFSWFQWGGQAYLGSDQTNATTTLASSTLSITLQSSRKYTFKSILYVSDSTAAEGVKIDFGGGTATATNFRTHCTGFDTALGISTQVTSLTSTVSAGTFTGNGMIECHGSFEVNSGGTFIPRFAQSTHAIGTLTLFRGSHLQVFDTP